MTAPWIAAFIALTVLALVEGVLVLGFLRRFGAALERLERVAPASMDEVIGGAAVGGFVDDFQVIDGSGRQVTAGELIQDRAIVLFMSSDCEPCQDVAAQLSSEQLESEPDVPLIVVIDEHDPGRLGLPAPVSVVRQRGDSVSRAFANRASPQAFLVRADRKVLDRKVPGNVRDLEQLGWRVRKEVSVSGSQY